MKQDKQGQLVCSWEEYWDYCNIVANSIIEDGKSYSQIIGILRGGFYPTFRTSLCKMIKVLKPSNLFWTKYK